MSQDVSSDVRLSMTRSLPCSALPADECDREHLEQAARAAETQSPQRAQVGQPASPNDPAAVRDYRARQRGG